MTIQGFGFWNEVAPYVPSVKMDRRGRTAVLSACEPGCDEAALRVAWIGVVDVRRHGSCHILMWLGALAFGSCAREGVTRGGHGGMAKPKAGSRGGRTTFDTRHARLRTHCCRSCRLSPRGIAHTRTLSLADLATLYAGTWCWRHAREARAFSIQLYCTCLHGRMEIAAHLLYMVGICDRASAGRVPAVCSMYLYLCVADAGARSRDIDRWPRSRCSAC